MWLMLVSLSFEVNVKIFLFFAYTHKAFYTFSHNRPWEWERRETHDKGHSWAGLQPLLTGSTTRPLHQLSVLMQKYSSSVVRYGEKALGAWVWPSSWSTCSVYRYWSSRHRFDSQPRPFAAHHTLAFLFPCFLFLFSCHQHRRKKALKKWLYKQHHMLYNSQGWFSTSQTVLAERRNLKKRMPDFAS